MYLLGLGLLLLLLKYFEYGFTVSLSWWSPWLWWPFGGAVLWWLWADWSGYTKRKEMDKEDKRRLERLNRHREAIGAKPKSTPPPRRR